MQKRTRSKVILNADRTTPSKTLCSSLKWIPFTDESFIRRSMIVYKRLKNSLIIQEQNTKKNHKRVVVLYVIKNHVNLHKL
jgi:hypothetical protein